MLRPSGHQQAREDVKIGKNIDKIGIYGKLLLCRIENLLK